MLEGASSSSNLVNLITHQISPEMIQSAAARLGEDRGKTASAISAGVPSVLAALSEVVRSDKGAAHLESAIASKAETPAGPAGSPEALLGTTGEAASGKGFLDEELGDKSWKISDAVAATSGINRSSAHSLQNGLTALTLATLGRHVGAGNAGALLKQQRGDVLKVLPTTMTSAFEGRGPQATRARVGGTGPRTLPHSPAPSRRWILPALIVAALIAIPWLRNHRHQAVTTAPTTPTPTEMQGTPPSPGLGDVSTAGQMAKFLADRSGAPTQRFTLSPMNFATGSATPTGSSLPTIDLAARVLKAHPSARVKIEGFADDAGGSGADLSQRRADNVKRLLVARGVESSRLDATGMGAKPPAPGRDTSAGGQETGRVDFLVTR